MSKKLLLGSNPKMRKGIAILWLLLLFSGISALFWFNEWKYSLPTPVPVGYHLVKPGDLVDLPAEAGFVNNKPVFLHFFNPDCPCSKFNIPHFKSLVKKYGKEISFVVVAICKDKKYTASDIQEKFGLDIPVLFDSSIANSCGVYSTPQAAIIDVNHKLYYRGNYNRSRYCSDKNSEYAQMAIDSLLSNHTSPVFGIAAVKSYGCSLPGCKRPG
jgi:hypothetical protein